MYIVDIDGGRVYLDGRLAKFVEDAVEHYVNCEDRPVKYLGEKQDAERLFKKLQRRYSDIDKENESIDHSSGWGELKE